MATKPAVRIPVWASGGSTVDPGAGKETAGWDVSEKPPATWFNWLQNAFGQWLRWAETSVDDLETDVAINKQHAAKIFGTIQTTTTGTNPTVLYDPFSEIASTGKSGTAVVINFGGLFNNVDQMIGFASLEGDDNHVVDVTTVDTNTVWITARNVSGIALDLTDTAAYKIKFVIFGNPY